MGTRADFYVGVGQEAEWLGSIAMDGYPDGPVVTSGVLAAITEDAYRKAVAKHLANDDYATLPKDGWPWPWEDSCTSDYAYCFEKDRVAIFCFGRPYIEGEDSDGPKAVFPNMKDRQNVTFGKRSGLLIIATSRSQR